MVFVSVRDEDGAHSIAVLHQIGYVRHAEVHARHILFGEQQPGVYDDDVIAELQRHHILSDFAQPAKRNDQQGRVRMLRDCQLCPFFLLGIRLLESAAKALAI